MHTRIKICGITSLSSAAAAIEAGADALGFNMYERSIRFIGVDAANEILRELPSSTIKVGLFVNHSEDEVLSITQRCSFDVLQFHGDEDNSFCASFSKPFMKAIRVGRETDIASEVARYPDSVAVLLDSSVKGKFGGTGISFDWQNVPKLTKPVFLAGGLDVNNVSEAVRTVSPYAVDVSGGVESSPGEKDPELIRAFVHAVQVANQIKELR
jgi:phosphoribosylanthranilate isomerase